MLRLIFFISDLRRAVKKKTCGKVLKRALTEPDEALTHKRPSLGRIMPKIMKLVDVAHHLGVPVRTFYAMLADGRFTVEPIPGSKPRRWNIEDVEAWRGASRVNRVANG